MNHDGPTLFGRSWLRTLKLDWKEIHVVNVQSEERDAHGNRSELNER